MPSCRIRRSRTAPARTAAPAADLTGQWDVRIDYAANTSSHTLHVKQVGNRLEGTHQGDFVSRDLAGTIDGNSVQMHSSVTERHGDALSFRFNGTVATDDDVGDARHGRVPDGEMDGEAARLSARRNRSRRTIDGIALGLTQRPIANRDSRSTIR